MFNNVDIKMIRALNNFPVLLERALVKCEKLVNKLRLDNDKLRSEVHMLKAEIRVLKSKSEVKIISRNNKIRRY